MSHIFLSAGHFLTNSVGNDDPGAVAFGTTEAKEVIATRLEIEKIFDSQNIEYSSVPDDLTLKQTIAWINNRSQPGDVAIEFHCNAFNGLARGTEAFFVAGNDQRKAETQLLLKALLDEVPLLNDRGAKPDTESQHSSLAFCRNVDIASILLELCFIDNRNDLDLLQNHRSRFAKGIADGLIEWSGQTPSQSKSLDFPRINIRIDDQVSLQTGLLVNDNSYIPVDLVVQLGIDSSQFNDALKIRHGDVVYVKAVELQKLNIAVAWDRDTKTVVLDSSPQENLQGAEFIMGVGRATQAQMEAHLDGVNREALQNFPDIAELYIEEAAKEGVNHDIAFCQMCLETGNLQFGNQVNANQNNFCGLGALDGGDEGASFNDVRTGVKACIQHLKAYGDDDAIADPPVVDPRFNLVGRGSATTVYDLAGKWASDPKYGEKIITILKRVNDVF